MKATNKLVQLLAAVAVVMVIATVLLYSKKKEVSTDFTNGMLLMQGVNPETVHKLEVRKGGDMLTLVRQDNGFVVVEKSNYPAQTKSVNELFLKILDIRCQTLVTEDTDKHKDLGLTADSPEEGSLAMYDKDGKQIAKVLVGKKPEHGNGPYLRLDGHPKAYTAEKSLFFNTTATSFMETKILDISKDKVSDVLVKTPKGSYTISNTKDDKAALQNVPKGKKAKQSDVDSVFGALSYFTFSDLVKANEPGITWDAEYMCKLKKHSSYKLTLGKKADKHYVRVMAIGPSQEEIKKNMSFRRDSSKEELKGKDEVLTANDDAQKFNRTHGIWAYEVSEWKAKNLRKDLAELVEDDKPEEPKKASAPGPLKK